MAAAESDLLKLLIQAFTRFLNKAVDAVLGAFRRFNASPDANGVWSAQPLWNDTVDDLIVALDRVAEQGWEDTFEAPYIRTNPFVQSQLATVRNLLVRIPDEVFQLVFAEITDGMTNGEDVAEIADRVDKVLSMTRSQRWVNRAKVIAQTEVLRAYNAGTFAAAQSWEMQLGIVLKKTWLATEDKRTRPEHRQVDGQERMLNAMFLVDDFPMLFPGDPMAPADLVINCRCTMTIEEV